MADDARFVVKSTLKTLNKTRELKIIALDWQINVRKSKTNNGEAKEALQMQKS